MRARTVMFLAAAVAGCSSTAKGAASGPGAPAPWRRAVLVELYTSQGCSSCPPADTFVRELPGLGLGRDKVIPLTFHVDYWDRLGWKDPFATNAFTKRQEWYADWRKLRSPDGTAGLDGLYTPQMIVDGAVQFSGQRRQTAVHEMELAAARSPVFDLAVRAAVKGSALDVTVQAAPLGDAGIDRDWRLVAALAARKAHTAVARGENAGETLEESAVVRALSERVAMPVPRVAARIQISKPADLDWSEVELVVFAQSEVTRAIGAVRMLDVVPDVRARR